MTFTQKFLRAKHWQLFLLTFALPVFVTFIISGAHVLSMVRAESPGPESLFNTFAVLPLIMVIGYSAHFAWFWSVAVGLQEKLPGHVTMNVKRFRILFFVPLAYSSIVAIGVALLMGNVSTMVSTNEPPDGVLVGSIILLMVPVHFFSMFCTLYCFYFAAKTIKTIETRRETSFSDFIGDLFLFWFYPIGVWILQPRINKIVTTAPEEQYI